MERVVGLTLDDVVFIESEIERIAQCMCTEIYRLTRFTPFSSN